MDLARRSRNQSRTAKVPTEHTEPGFSSVYSVCSVGQRIESPGNQSGKIRPRLSARLAMTDVKRNGAKPMRILRCAIAGLVLAGLARSVMAHDPGFSTAHGKWRTDSFELTSAFAF